MFPILHGLMSGISGGITFLFRDDFTTDEAAPIASPRTAEPGPGTADVTDTASAWPISGGYLSPTGATHSTNSPRYFGSNALAREAGVMARIQWKRISAFGAGSSGPCVGWYTSKTPGLYTAPVFGVYGDNSKFILVPDGVSVQYSVNNTLIDSIFILRNVGGFAMRLIAGEYVIDYVYNSGTQSPLFLGIWNANPGSYPYELHHMSVAQLPAPWDDDYGIATDRYAGNVTAGTEFAHEADCLIEFTITTVPSANSINVDFRIQDSDNYWSARIYSNGNIILWENVGGVFTQRGSSAGVIVSGDRIVIIADDTTIKVYEANALRITYSSASNFKTETAGELNALGTGGAVSDLVTWPRTLSGAAKAALDAVADA